MHVERRRIRIRKWPLPRRCSDWFCFLLLIVFFPMIATFELSVILPAFHTPGGFLHTVVFSIGLFIIFNITGNLFACILIDTSVNSVVCPPADAEEKEWWYCDDCDHIAPPRSYHCSVCRICILKSDHHCLFTGCCIGHYNHRYFAMFLFYFLFGSLLALIYNSVYFWVLNAHIFYNFLTVMKILCPIFLFFIGEAWVNWHLVFYNLTVLGAVMSFCLFLYHGPSVWKGGVSVDRFSGYPYNAGWRKNLQSIFGERMHLIWLSPFITSHLPQNGFDWDLNVTPIHERLSRNRIRKRIRDRYEA